MGTQSEVTTASGKTPLTVTKTNGKGGDLDELRAEVARLRAENEALAKAKSHGPGISLKVTEKGGVSAYGLGRFPVTLYKDQWLKLLAKADDITNFLAENESKLSVKPAK
jgi:hypothetical protein